MYRAHIRDAKFCGSRNSLPLARFSFFTVFPYTFEQDSYTVRVLGRKEGYSSVLDRRSGPLPKFRRNSSVACTHESERRKNESNAIKFPVYPLPLPQTGGMYYYYTRSFARIASKLLSESFYAKRNEEPARRPTTVCVQIKRSPLTRANFQDFELKKKKNRVKQTGKKKMPFNRNERRLSSLTLTKSNYRTRNYGNGGLFGVSLAQRSITGPVNYHFGAPSRVSRNIIALHVRNH